MFSKSLKRMLILGVLVVGCLVPAANAAAASVTVAPGGAVTGTGGRTVQFLFSTPRKTLNCTRLDFTATLAGTSGSYPLTISSNLQFVCSGSSRITGPAATSIACAPTARLNVTGPTASGASPLTITGISCLVTVIGTTCTVTIGGGLTGSFNNATSNLTVFTTGQSLTATGSSNGMGGFCSSLPNSTSLPFSDDSGGSPVFAVTPTTALTAV